MSLYKQYLEERTTDCIIESDHGFATYRYLDGFKTVYIIDIYVIPDQRKKGAASTLADMIAEEAKKMGAKEMLGTVVPSTKGSTVSLKVLLAYGFSLKSSGDNYIVMWKEI